MSFEIKILCDGNGCDSSIDVPSASQPEMELHAERYGWTACDTHSETHFCKACTEQQYQDALEEAKDPDTNTLLSAESVQFHSLIRAIRASDPMRRR